MFDCFPLRILFHPRKKMPKSTGYYLSEALILALINPKYDDRLFIDLQVSPVSMAQLGNAPDNLE